MYRDIKILMIGLMFFLGVPELGYSLTKDSVTMPETIKVDGHTLVLNGMGTRKATFFKVKVYVAGLYLEAHSKNPTEILNSDQLKRIDMQFVRNAPAEKISQAWEDSFKVNCKTGCEELRPSLEKLKASMVEMKSDDRMIFTFYPDALELQVKGKAAERIEGKELQKVILGSWLGPNPPNEDLKEGLLGIES